MSGEQILRIFAIRRWWIIACIILGSGVGIILGMTLPRVYDAKAQVIVSVGEDIDISVAESAIYVDDRMPTLLEISRSADFAEQVAASPAIDLRPDQIRGDLEATVIPETTIIEIHASDENLDRARTLADTAAKTMTEPFVASRLGSDNGVEVEVLQRAEAGTAAVFPDPRQFLGIGTLAGLVIGLLVALLRHGLDRRVRDGAEIRSILDAELLAVRMRRPSRSVRRQLDRGGAATSVHGLIARLGLIGRARGTVTVSIVGVGGTGAEIAVDLVKTAAASGMRCALVTVEPNALSSAQSRRLSAISGVEVVDVSVTRGTPTVRRVRETLCSCVDQFDLVVCLNADLADRPEMCGFLNMSDFAVVATPPQPMRAHLRATQELLRASDLPAAGYVLVDAPVATPNAGNGHRPHINEASEDDSWLRSGIVPGSADKSNAADVNRNGTGTIRGGRLGADRSEPDPTTMPIFVTGDPEFERDLVAVTVAKHDTSTPVRGGRSHTTEGEQS